MTARLSALSVLVWALLVTGAPAFAHATLLASDPSAGAQVERAPQSVTLTFDEAVEGALGSLRVLDASGTLRSDGPVVHPNGDPHRISVRVEPVERGRYVVSWQVISADSHLVDGAFAFGVGVAAGDAPMQLAPDNGARLLLPIVHFFLLTGMLLGVGIPIGLATIARRTRRRPMAVEFGAWAVVVFTAFTDAAFRADLAGGTLATAFGTHVGELRSITMGAGLFALVALMGKQRAWPVLALASAAAALSLSLAGHAAGGNVPFAGIVADLLHLLGAAAWIGVLAVALTLDAGPELRRITPVAVTAVGVLIVTGIVQTVRNAGSFAALLGTDYGHAIDVKIGLLVVLLALALGAQRALARGTFRIAGRIRLELWLLTAVIGATAVLVEQPLPLAPAPAPAAVLFSVRDIGVRASAVAAGAQNVTITVTTTAPLDAIDVRVRETRRNVGPLSVTMKRDDETTFAGTVTLPFVGEWTATVSARSGAFDEARRTISLPETSP